MTVTPSNKVPFNITAPPLRGLGRLPKLSRRKRGDNDLET